MCLESQDHSKHVLSLSVCSVPAQAAIPNATVLNTVADAISRDNLLFLKAPDADPRPAIVPSDLVEILVTSQPDWTNPNWRYLFGNCLRLA